MRRTRRAFLGDVGRGMLLASVGPALFHDRVLSAVDADEDTLDFGALEPLAALMQETAPDKLQPLLVEKLKSGTDLDTLIAAGALANARSFGGHDYVGFHAFMALVPAHAMSKQLPADRAALPVLKVLYRSAARIQENGGREAERLRPIATGETPSGDLHERLVATDLDGAERMLAARDPSDAFNELQSLVQEQVDVHRVILPWRAWDTLRLTGKEHATTLLRQSIRFCMGREQERVRKKRPEPPLRTLLPKLIDEHALLSKEPNPREASDEWTDALGRTVFGAERADAAQAVAAALAEGYSHEAVGEALSLAGTRLLLHDKPGGGSVHGASVGVHASDAANAWRHVARATNRRNAIASLIVGAYHTAGQSGRVGGEPLPFEEQAEKIEAKDAATLLDRARSCIENRDQQGACATIHRYGTLGHESEPVFDLLLEYAVSEDGALHAEKYYHTVREEFASSRPAFRLRHLVALARVTASEYGERAPGHDQASELLGL